MQKAKQADCPMLYMYDDNCMAACECLGFMTQKVLSSLSEDSCDSAKPTKMIAQQENYFWKDHEKHFSITLLKVPLNQIEHSKY